MLSLLLVARSLTKIINPHHLLKTYTGQSEMVKALESKYHVRDVFVEVEKEILVAVVARCQGNAHRSIGMVHQLLMVRERYFDCLVEQLHSDS